ncbi:MAG TPA: hypothetical protein V6C76_01090 [Drouetiella sp.]
MLLTDCEKAEVIESAKQTMKVAVFVLVFVFFQQSYARARESAIEQPVGLVGFAEMFFRHPEGLVGLHFDYPVQRFSGDHLGE